MIPIESIKTIQDRMITVIEFALEITVPPQDVSAFRIQSLAYAGEIALLQGYGADAQADRFPQTASERFLEILGGLKGITRNSGQPWRGEVEAEATGTGTIPSGATYTYNAGGSVYSVDDSITIIPGILTFNISALWDYKNGESTSINPGDELDITSGIPGLSNISTVTATTQDGSDVEALEDYRIRVIDAYRITAQGGAAGDYLIWGRQAADVISIYPYSASFPGAVNVYVEVGDQPDGIPTQAQLDAVLASIKFNENNEAYRRPVTASIYVLPITRRLIDVRIIGLTPDTQTVRDTIEYSLTNQLFSYYCFIEGISIKRADRVTSSRISSVTDTSANLQNSTYSILELRNIYGKFNSYTLAEGEKAKLGEITYV